MWKYIRKFLPYAVFAAVCMVGEVLMDLIQPTLMSRIIDEGVLGSANNGASDMELIWTLGIRMILLVLFGGLCGSLNNVFSHLAAQNAGNEIRKDAFRNILSFSFEQMDHYTAGSLVVRVTNDITQIQNFISMFFRGIIRTSCLTFGSIICMFLLYPLFGWIVLAVCPLIVLFLVFCLVKVNPLFDRLQAQIDEINAIMQEDISGIRIIKACVRELYEKARFGKANDALVRTQLHTLVIFALMNPVINALMYFAVALLVVSGGNAAAVGGATPGTVMAAITYTTTLLNGILGLVMIFQNFSRGLASWRRVKEILDEQPQMKDGSGHFEKQAGHELQPQSAGAGCANAVDARLQPEPQPEGAGREDAAAAGENRADMAEDVQPDAGQRGAQAQQITAAPPAGTVRTRAAGAARSDAAAARSGAGAARSDAGAAQSGAGAAQSDAGAAQSDAAAAQSGAGAAQSDTAAPPAGTVRTRDAAESPAVPAVELRHVSFAYPGTDHTILEDINLKVMPGETIGIMGATGCGKTTLVGLIPRFYDVSAGQVLVFGRDVRDVPKLKLREQIAVVLQKSELFSTTIRENISWGNPHASDADIRRAAQTAQADGFISELATGYDTPVAERGMSLSGGQKQRLSIARAVLKNAGILIFDDATSALDLKTEADLYRALQAQSPGSAKIIVAQRIATVRGADRIAVLENKRIAAVGSHAELMQTCAAYREIYRSQFGEDEE